MNKKAYLAGSGVFYFAGSGCQAGRMICSKCNQKINSETEDWSCKEVYIKKRHRREDKHGDGWRYETTHRKCCTDDKEWGNLEDKAKKHEQEVLKIVDVLSQYCVDGEFSDVFIEAYEKCLN